VKEDVEKDVAAAVSAEEEAIADYSAQKTDLEASVTAAGDAIAAYEEETSTLESEKIDKDSEKTLKKDQLSGIMSEIKALQPGCDYILVNFDARVQKRHIEIDGLEKAKAILQGADFS